MVKCPKCNYDLKFCNNCGRLLPPLEEIPRDSKNNLLCPFCKEIIMYCPHCGYDFSEIKIQEQLPIPNIKKIDSKAIKSLIEKIKEESLKKEDFKVEDEVKTIAQKNLFCFFHPSKNANKECDICSKPICEDCIRKYGDLILCPDDYNNIIKEISSIETIESKKINMISFSLSIISALLIFWNALSWIFPLSIIPTFSIFFFLENIYLAIISAICSFIIILGALLSIKLKKETPGGMIIMFFSLASLTVGGGFLIGSILGILGALTNFIMK